LIFCSFKNADSTAKVVEQQMRLEYDHNISAGKDLKESICGLFEGAVLVLVWRD
jgi:hypothetical protein